MLCDYRHACDMGHIRDMWHTIDITWRRRDLTVERRKKLVVSWGDEDLRAVAVAAPPFESSRKAGAAVEQTVQVEGASAFGGVQPFGDLARQKKKTLFLIEEIKGYESFDFPGIASPDVRT